MMHPAAQQTIERVLGIEWAVCLFDFNCVIGISAKTAAGQRVGVRVQLDEPVSSVVAAYAKHADLIAQGKTLLVEKLNSH